MSVSSMIQSRFHEQKAYSMIVFRIFAGRSFIGGVSLGAPFWNANNNFA